MKRIDVVAAVIVRDGCVLATERGYGAYEGWWEFPGGKLEPGETGPEALTREILEEMDAHIVVERLLRHVSWDYPEFRLEMDCYLCRLEDEFTLLEHHAARWLSAGELDSVKWLPADDEVLAALVAEGVVG